jgi:hypothetical protein
MPAESRPNPFPMTRTERKQQLVLACMADRLAWVQACEPSPQPPLAKAGRILQMLEPFIGLMPGRLGRWIRNAHFIGSLLPTVGKYILKNLTGAAARSAQTESAGSPAEPDRPRNRPAAGN